MRIAAAEGATAGREYVAKALAGASTPAEQLAKVFTVTLDGDTTVEPSEHLRVAPSNTRSNATLSKYLDTGTIRNDD